MLAKNVEQGHKRHSRLSNRIRTKIKKEKMKNWKKFGKCSYCLHCCAKKSLFENCSHWLDCIFEQEECKELKVSLELEGFFFVHFHSPAVGLKIVAKLHLDPKCNGSSPELTFMYTFANFKRIFSSTDRALKNAFRVYLHKSHNSMSERRPNYAHCSHYFNLARLLILPLLFPNNNDDDPLKSSRAQLNYLTFFKFAHYAFKKFAFT